MSVGGLGGVVQPEGLAFEKHSVVVDQHRPVNKFERFLTVILEVADCVEGIGIVAFGFDFEAQLDGLALCDFVAVWHDFHGEGIGLLHVEVAGTGGQSEDESEEDCPVTATRFRSGTEKEPEESAGSKADVTAFVDDCFHVFQSLSFVDFFG